MTQLINENKYIYPEVLVDTQWVEDHIDDKNVRIAEVDYDAKANYDLGHVPDSVLIAWKEDINDPLARNILTLHEYVQLLQRIGVNNDTTLILYGDFNNWFAAFALWVFKYYRYKNVKLLNGSRKKWLQEDRPITKDIPQYPPGNYRILSDESSYEPDNNMMKLRTHL